MTRRPAEGRDTNIPTDENRPPSGRTVPSEAEDAADALALARYRAQQADGSSVTVPHDEVRRRLGVEAAVAAYLGLYTPPRLREQAGLSATQAGQLHGTIQSRISNFEPGGCPVSAERVRTLASLYFCSGQALVDGLTRMTGGRTRGWWEEYREVPPAEALDLAELEHHAQSMRIASAIHSRSSLSSGSDAGPFRASSRPLTMPCASAAPTGR